jgi:hypothetical protein
MLTARHLLVALRFRGMRKAVYVDVGNARWSVRRSLFAMIGAGLAIWGAVLALILV